uniref:Uncharacterized protein n=1 Tax=Candidatus Kentrum sp. FW TaxID=2126338 RepID=A0A450TPD0_9GAMM|nr:MAG: hypothetical protein BECKFW1821C_GA0114237_10207 [Candidatus Kentron sp. FW]
MRHDPSKDIDCRWIQSNEPVDTEPVITLNAESSTALLHCERIVYSKAGYVKIARINGQQAVTTIPWQAYDQNGLPVDPLGALKKHYEAMVSELSGFQGSVVAFDAQECPSGWSEYAQAYGRFVRGIDKIGEKTVKTGSRGTCRVMPMESTPI